MIFKYIIDLVENLDCLELLIRQKYLIVVTKMNMNQVEQNPSSVRVTAPSFSACVDFFGNGYVFIGICSVNDYTVENGGSNYSTQFKDLGKLVASINGILGKLSAPSASSSKTSKSSSATRGSTADAYQASEPERQPYNRSGVVFPPVYPGIGGNDLFPGPGAGMYPSRGDFGIGGGNQIGPDNPIFNMRFDGQRPVFPGAMPPGVPPGARFDPYGPPGVPGFEPNRFARNPPRPGGGIHPDLEQFGRDDFI